MGKHFTGTSNKVELRINRVRINRARPVFCFVLPDVTWDKNDSVLKTVCQQLIPLHKSNPKALGQQS